ncbi:hypothetical protein IEO21_07556 [Rhodonia placenta]|uniref:Secreted protein n=1 Tax=Rhodonia placenta TaxID=104341 RepID=A0A8H7U028_9APHY|nr:hypothetical protein IEO21_07556 [Postia placenta]
MHCVAYLLLFDVNAGPADALGIVLPGPQIQIYDAACGSTRRPSRSTGSTESHCAEPVTSRVLGAQLGRGSATHARVSLWRASRELLPLRQCNGLRHARVDRVELRVCRIPGKTRLQCIAVSLAHAQALTCTRGGLAP